MKRIASIAALLFAAVVLRAQTAPEGYQYVDSLVFTRLSEVDSTLAGKNIFSETPSGITEKMFLPARVESTSERRVNTRESTY